MNETREGPCSPWVTAEQLATQPPCDSTSTPVPPAVAAEAVEVASWLLYERTGRRFPGVCTDTVRPCRQPWTRDGRRSTTPFDGTGASSALWGWCRCGGSPDRARCQCGHLSEIRLGWSPIVNVVQVLIDGVPLDPSEYRVDDHRWLVRLPDLDGVRRSWPCAQRMDLPSTEDDTFEVTFEHGVMPPAALVMAARVLACSLASAVTPGMECRLPDRVSQVVRQGIAASFVDPAEFFGDGLTGIYEVDLVLSTYPRLRGSRSRVISPNGFPSRSHRRTTAEFGPS